MELTDKQKIFTLAIYSIKDYILNLAVRIPSYPHYDHPEKIAESTYNLLKYEFPELKIVHGLYALERKGKLIDHWWLEYEGLILDFTKVKFFADMKMFGDLVPSQKMWFIRNTLLNEVYEVFAMSECYSTLYIK